MLFNKWKEGKARGKGGNRRRGRAEKKEEGERKKGCAGGEDGEDKYGWGVAKAQSLNSLLYTEVLELQKNEGVRQE